MREETAALSYYSLVKSSSLSQIFRECVASILGLLTTKAWPVLDQSAARSGPERAELLEHLEDVDVDFTGEEQRL